MITSQLDVSADFLDIRDQGVRYTCVAMSISALHEYSRGSKEYLSVEFLHYKARQRQGSFSDGIELIHGRSALEIDGQCCELECPYLSIEPNEIWKPSLPKHIVLRPTTTVPCIIDEIDQSLDAGRPLVVGLSITNQWQEAIIDTIEYDKTSKVLAGHAVVIVGRGISAKGKGYYKIRNSWGQNWGIRGYCWVCTDYILNMAIELFE